MGIEGFFQQTVNGLANGAVLFLIAAGLTLIFGVARIVNFAHGLFFVLGLYVAGHIAPWLYGGLGPSLGAFLLAAFMAALLLAVIGALVEWLIFRRLYGKPELLPLLASFALALIGKDLLEFFFGAEDRLAPMPPGLGGAIEIGNLAFARYDLFLMVSAGLIGAGLWYWLARTKSGRWVRAAREDRAMLAAFGVDPARLMLLVVAVATALGGLGGALASAREAASLHLDGFVIADAFVIVVMGGMGSLPGALMAAILIGLVKAYSIGLGQQEILGIAIDFSKLTLVIEFLAMALVLALRPQGLMGKPEWTQDAPPHDLQPLPRPPYIAWALILALAMTASLFWFDRYGLVLMTDIAIFALFVASLHWLAGPVGLVSFGHAASFALGAYGFGLLLRHDLADPWIALALAPFLAAAAMALIAWLLVRRAGIYHAMLTLAFAQLIWSILHQWDSVTGGSNGIIGLRPPTGLGEKTHLALFTIMLVGAMILFLWWLAHTNFGRALRAGRDAPLRAQASGYRLAGLRSAAILIAAFMAGLAGALSAIAKGSIAPDLAAIPRTVDALAALLLGGLGSLMGPVLGAGLFVFAQDQWMREIEWWRTGLGLMILGITLFAPHGLAMALPRFFKERA